MIVASCALNEGIGDSVVGRMQYELGLQRVTPFALGQNGTLGWYSALMLLDGLLRDEGDQALVILSDKWLYPFFRQFGDLVGYGDAAAALLVSRAGPSPEPAAWGGVRSVALEFGPSIADPWADAPATLRDTLAPVAAGGGPPPRGGGGPGGGPRGGGGGSDDYNLALSKHRAESVAAYLKAHGLKTDSMTVSGRGKADPVASNATPEGRASNRRVEIRLQH
ncbi:OmpA family protein [Burkholderia sp. LAS2]|uniref:OmpA family protein n=1 Tax=Burkholderia sp. LAS2 TaxID=2813843 RepID=UPI00201B6021|nr:OmpA family protein [Burkholderia sp. LAS2]